MTDLPNCPKCNGEYVYEEGNLLVCPECSHEWSKFEDELKAEQTKIKEEENAVKDAVGNQLFDGDSAVMVKDVKIGSSSDVLKQGAKVQDIRLEENGPHDVVAKVDGFGVMELKSELIKKTN